MLLRVDGYALQRLDPDEAARTLALFAEAGLDGGGPAAEAAVSAPGRPKRESFEQSEKVAQ